MEHVMKWFSPRSSSGSVMSAVLVHGLLYGSLVAAFGFGVLKKSEPPPAEVEVGYEVFDEPPVPTQVVKQVMRMPEPETPPTKNEAPDDSPKELQDEKSDVAGTQTAPKAQANIGSVSNGTADATPFYKIKPKYPRAALVEGSEGWILLKIDITEAGVVENVRIVDGEKRNLFQDEARRAVEKWKYRPFLDGGGKPIRKADHQVRVDFKLSDV